MTIEAISPGNLGQLLFDSGILADLQQAWQSLEQNLGSGNLAAALLAFKSCEQINQKLPLPSGSAPPEASSSQAALPPALPQREQVMADFHALGMLLNSGDLAGARQALTTLQRDLNGAQLPALLRAETPARQAVRMVEDWVDLSGTGSAPANLVDPTMLALATAYGVQDIWGRQAEEERKRKAAALPSRKKKKGDPAESEEDDPDENRG